jgi:hypothetical protein
MEIENISHNFPNPREEKWLNQRLQKLSEENRFCDCDDKFHVDGFCWSCLMPCDPRDMVEVAVAGYEDYIRYRNEKQGAKAPASYSQIGGQNAN